MKIFLRLLVVALMVVGFTACSSSKNVVKFSLTMNDATSKTVLTLTPDYSKRSLGIDYKKDYIDKKQQSVASTGQLGGEYFDRLELMAKAVRNYKAPENQVFDEKKANLIVIDEEAKNTYSVQIAADAKTEEAKSLVKFYNDVVKLLVQSEPI